MGDASAPREQGLEHGAFQQVGDELWTLTRPLRFLAMEMGTRMTVARLDGELWVHSPVALTPELRDELDALGTVRWVVAPNRWHHLYVPDFAAAYPEAELLCPPGLASKRSDIAWTREVTDSLSEGDAIEGLRIGGMPMMDELVFVHRPSRTLILTDLLVNWHSQGDWLMDLVCKLDGVSGRPAVPRNFRAFLVRDRARIVRDTETVLGWDFDRLLLAHGLPLASGAKDAVARAFGKLKR